MSIEKPTTPKVMSKDEIKKMKSQTNWAKLYAEEKREKTKSSKIRKR